MAINYNNSRKLNEAIRWLYVLLLTLITLNSCQNQTNTWSLSEKEYHYNERLSALSSDKEGYWVGSETGVVCQWRETPTLRYRIRPHLRP
ncbi:hypothetical protein [Prevotella intermedia]|uniref:hypothetical protein n=1 Tax=Prevotella intermedia TaxID=28131 RepID=UPI001E4A9528|nr:hypothetical protein [Prevotella intermedia]